jgi:hypothetical protein
MDTCPSRGDDHESASLVAAVGDDAALGVVPRLAPQDQLCVCVRARARARVSLGVVQLLALQGQLC